MIRSYARREISYYSHLLIVHTKPDVAPENLEACEGWLSEGEGERDA